MLEPLVLLPGMMCDARLFAPQIAALSHQRPILVVPLTGANTMTELASRVLNCAPSAFALAGLSMGGIVAMEIMRQAPERVTRLALMDTNPRADTPERAANRAAQIEQCRRGALHAIMRDEMKPHYLADGPYAPKILDLCMSMAESLGPEVFEDQSTALLGRSDQRKTLRSISLPTLILCGQEDRLCPVSRHDEMHQLIAGSQLVVVSSAGHMPALEQPEATTQALTTWLNL